MSAAVSEREQLNPSVVNRPVKLAVVCDLVEENWPSMNLVAEMLLHNLSGLYSESLTAQRICPGMRWRFTRPNGSSSESARTNPTKRVFNADRLINRMWDYPRKLRRERDGFDLFHIVDHSYSHLVHQLDPARV